MLDSTSPAIVAVDNLDRKCHRSSDRASQFSSAVAIKQR